MPGMPIDNFVTVEVATSEFPATWRVVNLSRPVSGRVDGAGLFEGDEVNYLQATWSVFDIRDGGRQLVLRPA